MRIERALRLQLLPKDTGLLLIRVRLSCGVVRGPNHARQLKLGNVKFLEISEGTSFKVLSLLSIAKRSGTLKVPPPV